MIYVEDDIYDDKNNKKKNLINSISYTINKKMNVYDSKLDIIIKKLDSNFEDTKNIVEHLKLNNKNLEIKINNLEEKIISLENIIFDLKKDKIEIDKKIFKKEEKLKEEKLNEEKLYDNNEIEQNNEKNDIIQTYKYKDVKEESIELDYDFIKSCLESANIHNDIKIFKKIYIDNIPKEYYPIRHIKKKFQYWKDNHMNDDDSNGTYIKNTILKNIEYCYLKVNIYENYNNNIDQLLKNQEHINKLREEKYKDKLLLKIISIINI
jgi:hypothetical protein